MLALILALAAQTGIYAEDSESAQAAQTEQADDGIFVDVNYDDKVQEIYQNGEVPTISYQTVGGNTYMDVKTNWTQSGYLLKNPIPNDGDDYNLSFDFAVTEPSGSYYFLMLSERASEVGENTYHQFGILNIDANGTFKTGGCELSGATWEKDKWYSYKMTFNRKSRHINVEITDKSNPENKAMFDGISPLDGPYGRGFPDRSYDILKFSAKATLKIDNILLEESREKPLVVTGVSTDHAGNVFGKDDVKEIRVGMRNVLNNTIKADIGYKLIDEDKNVVDSGKIENVTLGAREKKESTITVNMPRYCTYRIEFEPNITEGADNVQKNYEIGSFMLSMANKRAADEPLNQLTAANIEYIYTEDEWKPIKELLTQAGISSVRKEIYWSSIETSPGVYKRPDYTFYLEDSKNAGIDYLAIISPYSSLYAGGYERWQVDQMDEDGVEGIWDKWEKHLEWLANEYKDQVKYYEIFNEPNERATPEIYAKYLEVAHRAIKKYDPDGIVVGFSTASMPWAWIEQMLEIVGKDPHKYLDAISVHPYDFDYGEYMTKAKNASLAWSTLFRDQWFIDKNTRLKGLMEQYGCADIPVLGTEIGMTSTPLVFSMKQQAADMMQMFATDNVEGILDRIWIYCFENTGTRGSADYSMRDTEDNFGIVGNRDDTVPFAAKPSYIALCAYNRMMTDAEYIDKVINDPTRAYRFKRRDGKQVVMLWSEHNSENIALDLGVDEVEIYDQYSNPMGTLKSDNGAVNLTATFEPIYIVGDFTKMERKDNTIEIDKGRIDVVTGDNFAVNITDKKGRNLKVETKGTPNAVVSDETQISGGKGSVNITISDDPLPEEPIDIKVYDGDNLIYYSRIHTILGYEGVSFDYTLADDPVTKGRRVVKVSATNKTAGMTLTGELSADFTKSGGKKESRMMVDLKPGQTKTVYMNVPKSTFIQSVGAPIKISMGDRFNIEDTISVIDNMEVLYNNSGKKDATALDGDLSGSSQFAAQSQLAAQSIASWGGTDDCSMTGTLRWDEDNLYIYAAVKDDVFFQDKTGYDVWEADGLQLGVQDPAQVGVTEAAFTEVGVTKTKNGNEVYKYSNMPGVSGGIGLLDNPDVSIDVVSGGVIYKMAFPWKYLIGKDTVSAGDMLRFNISANESDGAGRRGWIEVTEGICGSKNAQLFGTITLKK